MEALIILVLFAWLVLAATGLAGMVFWVWALVDCAQREFETKDEKTAWILILIFTSYIGMIFYYFLIMRKHKKRK